MKRVRLLIYDGDEKWIENSKKAEITSVENPWTCGFGTIRSIEIEPEKVTLTDIYRKLQMMEHN
jgi:hypothetical protein